MLINVKKIQLALGLVLVCAFYCGPAAASSPITAEEAAKAVETFCQAEFNGNDSIRIDSVKYSKKRAAQEQGRDALGRITYITNDPLFIVSSYKVLDASVVGTRATVHVEFHRLAKTRDEGEKERRFVADYLEHDVVAYVAVYLKRKWWIYDPPLPRISREAAIAKYQEDMSNTPAGFLDDPAVTENQKQIVRKEAQELEFLKALSPDTLPGTESATTQ